MPFFAFMSLAYESDIFFIDMIELCYYNHVRVYLLYYMFCYFRIVRSLGLDKLLPNDMYNTILVNILFIKLTGHLKAFHLHFKIQILLW